MSFFFSQADIYLPMRILFIRKKVENGKIAILWTMKNTLNLPMHQQLNLICVLFFRFRSWKNH